MSKRDDPDVVVQIRIDNKKWETMCEKSSSSIFTKSPSLWSLVYCADGSFNFRFEVEAKPRSLVFVIRDRLPEFHLGLVKDSDWCHWHLPLISANTSSAGRPDAVPSRTI